MRENVPSEKISVSWSLMRHPQPSLSHGLDLAPFHPPEIRGEDTCPAYLTLLSESQKKPMKCSTATRQHRVSLSSPTHPDKHLQEKMEEMLVCFLALTSFVGAQRSPRRSRLTKTPNKHCATYHWVLWPSLTLKLRLDFPGAGGKPTEHLAVVVLKD